MSFAGLATKSVARHMTTRSLRLVSSGSSVEPVLSGESVSSAVLSGVSLVCSGVEPAAGVKGAFGRSNSMGVE